MHKEHPLLEILPLNEQESVTVSVYTPAAYPASPHYHPEYELLLTTGEGVYRQIGDTVQQTTGTELILLGPNIYHKWKIYPQNSKTAQVISINFNEHFLKRLDKEENGKLTHTLQHAGQGILFTAEIISKVKENMQNLVNLKKKALIKELTNILITISEAKDYGILCTNRKSSTALAQDATMEDLTVYLKKNYKQKLTLEQVCLYTGKSATSFNRFIRKHTGTTFTNYMNSIRAGFAARSLIETTQSVASVAQSSGFNNLALFNRVFKKTFGITPLRYREVFYGRKKFL